MRFVPSFLELCAGLGLLACSSSAVTTTDIVRPQLLSVSPDDFLGAVQCRPDFDPGEADAGGSSAEDAPAAASALVAKSYVATVTDITPTDTNGGIVGFVLPSSPPTPCSQPVTFSYVIAYHSYIAHVEAYTENARDLVAFAPGSPLLLDKSGNRVNARWTGDCSGYPPSFATAGGGGTSGTGGADAGADAGGTLGKAGNPGAIVYDTLTQTPQACGNGLTLVE